MTDPIFKGTDDQLTNAAEEMIRRARTNSDKATLRALLAQRERDAEVIEAAGDEPVSLLKVEVIGGGDGTPLTFAFTDRKEAQAFSKKLAETKFGQVLDWVQRCDSTAESAFAVVEHERIALAARDGEDPS